MVNDPRFDIPPELREMVEKNVEQAQAAYGQFIEFLTQVSSMAPASKMLPGLEPVRERAIEFAKKNGECFFDLANALARAKDIQEVLTLQSQYAQTQMQSCLFRPKSLEECWQGYYPPMAERSPSPELSSSPRLDLEPHYTLGTGPYQQF